MKTSNNLIKKLKSLLVCLSISCIFQLNAQTISNFTLVDANTGTDLADLVDYQTINLNQFSAINVKANTEGAIGSVVFYVNGTKFRTENAAPYALAGDNSGNFYSWTPAIGSTTITAEAYSNSGGNGTLLSTKSLIVSIIDDPNNIYILDLNFNNCPTTSLEVGDVVDLDVTLFPANVTNDFVAFTASDGLSVDYLDGTFTANAPGEYIITATSFSDGSVYDTCTITVNDSSSSSRSTGELKQQYYGFKTKIYPNPVVDLLSIQFDTGNKYKIRLFDLTGSKLIENFGFDNSLELDLTTFDSGVYVLEIEQNGEVYHNRILKKKSNNTIINYRI